MSRVHLLVLWTKNLVKMHEVLNLKIGHEHVAIRSLPFPASVFHNQNITIPRLCLHYVTTISTPQPVTQLILHHSSALFTFFYMYCSHYYQNVLKNQSWGMTEILVNLLNSSTLHVTDELWFSRLWHAMQCCNGYWHFRVPTLKMQTACFSEPSVCT